MTETKNPTHAPALAADKAALNIQETFLNNARRDRSLVTLYLMNGAKLTGKIRSFDKYSLIFEANHQEQLIFKHAIATVALQARSGASGASSGNSQPSSPPTEA